MSRARYFPVDARLRQLAREVARNPGCTLLDLAKNTGVSYITAAAYMKRVVREGNAVSVSSAPPQTRGVVHRFYPPEAPAARKVAA